MTMMVKQSPFAKALLCGRSKFVNHKAYCEPGQTQKQTQCTPVSHETSDSKAPSIKSDDHAVAGHVTSGQGKVDVTYDKQNVNEDEAKMFMSWLSAVPEQEMRKSAVKRVEVFSDPEQVARRLEEVGIDPEVGPDGVVRGAFDFDTGTLYASSWDGHENTSRNLLHELGHSILGMDEDAAESWADAHSSGENDQPVKIDNLRELLPKDPATGRMGVKPIGKLKIEGYRVGDVTNPHGRGVFLAGEQEGAEWYASGHQDQKVEKYQVQFENALLVGHQNDIIQEFFKTTYAEMQDRYAARARSQVVGGQKVDVKIAKEAIKRGYDGIVYLRPAPPAKSEIVVLGDNELTNIGQQSSKPLEIRTKDLKPHSKGCLMAVLPENLKKAITDWTIENVLPEHLGPDGVQFDSHITCAYGFTESTPETVDQIKAMLNSRGPMQVQLLEMHYFDGTENKDGTPLIVEVESQQLRKLNADLMASFPIENKHPEYKPHVTLAYLSSNELAEYYERMTVPFTDQLITVEEFEWSGADGHRERIKLSFLPQFKAYCEPGQTQAQTGCTPASPSTAPSQAPSVVDHIDPADSNVRVPGRATIGELKQEASRLEQVRDVATDAMRHADPGQADWWQARAVKASAAENMKRVTSDLHHKTDTVTWRDVQEGKVPQEILAKVPVGMMAGLEKAKQELDSASEYEQAVKKEGYKRALENVAEFLNKQALRSVAPVPEKKLAHLVGNPKGKDAFTISDYRGTNWFGDVAKIRDGFLQEAAKVKARMGDDHPKASEFDQVADAMGQNMTSNNWWWNNRKVPFKDLYDRVKKWVINKETEELAKESPVEKKKPASTKKRVVAGMDKLKEIVAGFPKDQVGGGKKIRELVGFLSLVQANEMAEALGLKGKRRSDSSDAMPKDQIAAKLVQHAAMQNLGTDPGSKSMSWLDSNSGGSLVPPPQQGSTMPAKRNKLSLLRKKYRKHIGYGQAVEITEGEYAGYTGIAYGNLPQHGAIGTPRSRWGELQIRVQIDGFPKPGEWNGAVTVRESWLKTKSLLVYGQKGMFSTVRQAAQWFSEKWAKLEARYGRRAALAMIVAMTATMPMPGNIVAVVGAAEAIRGLHGYVSGKKAEAPDPVKEDSKVERQPVEAPNTGTCKPGERADQTNCTPAKSFRFQKTIMPRVKSSPFYQTKDITDQQQAGSMRGKPCKPGYTPERDGCIPTDKQGQGQQQPGQAQQPGQQQAQAAQPFSPESKAKLDKIRKSGKDKVELPGIGEVDAVEIGEKPDAPGQFQAYIPGQGYVDVDLDALAQEQQQPKEKSFVPPPPGEKIVEPPCCLSDPDPNEVDPETGVTRASRVGVPGFSVPPPPNEIPRLPNLTEIERRAEARFADYYLEHVDECLAHYEKGRNHVVGYKVKKGAGLAANLPPGIKGKADKDDLVINGEEPQLSEFLKSNNAKGSPIYEIGDAPNIFNTDDVKLLSPDYNPGSGTDDEKKAARGIYNTAVHQTANVIAKRAFLKHLDDVVAKMPEEKRMVLVTSGGVASGKGFALGNVETTRELTGKVGAVWDAAGEQNATENPWVMAECKKRGIVPIFAFIHANPLETWENEERGVVERANKIGRMVDSKLFAESYSIGAKNFKAFHDKHKDSGEAEFFVIDNTKGGKPQLLTDVPQEALEINSDHLNARASKVLKDREESLRPSVVRGGSIGDRIWGMPAEETWGE